MARFIAASLLLLAACTRTPAFRDASGHVVPGSVATMEDVDLNAVRQRIWLRGLSTANPPLILVHGGPGVSESPLFRAFTPELERHFLVVYWEQRGTGRSFDPGIPAASMRIEQFVADLDVLVRLVQARFGQRRAVILAHSWGTAPGLLYAARHPEAVLAYVGVSQVTDMPEGERLSWRHALDEAVARENIAAERALRRIGPPPNGVDAMLVSRKWNERFGGSFHGNLSTAR